MGTATKARRVTVYFDPDLHRALRMKAAETERSLSDLVNEAVREALLEDAEDLAAFYERREEKLLTYEEMVRELKQDGKL